MVARDPKTLALGAAASTAIPAVGSTVPHVEVNVGAIATQAQTNISYGIEGLKLLKQGLLPQEALDAMLTKDKDREKRQVIMLDAQGRAAAFTGNETEDWKGHHIGTNHVAAGNLLAGAQVVEAMTAAFENQKANLAERLLKALEAGQQAGGDKRGRMSAALKVADPGWKNTSRPIIDLRVDAHPEPVKELRRVYTVSRSYFDIPE
ncbi:MAG TPA: DUF1028 domain-containing protein [Candidatus Bathyarchaeia archaeon]|nr:DUF1028 domain-containing protein [Candidatus Bathyarchaeia archaeon]